MRGFLAVTLIVQALQTPYNNIRAQRTSGAGDETAPSSAKNQAASTWGPWEGTYIFQEGGERTAGGTGVFVEHTIKVYRRNGRLIADLDATGFLVSRNIRCATKPDGDKINFHFESYREDNITEPYRQGQLLLTLRRTLSGRRTRILTYWGAYRPAIRAARSGRVYFRKIG